MFFMPYLQIIVNTSQNDTFVLTKIPIEFSVVTWHSTKQNMITAGLELLNVEGKLQGFKA